MMLSFMGISGHHSDAFLLKGGVATLANYSIAVPEGPPGRSDDQRLLEALQPDNVEFFMGLEPWYFMDGFVCVHAGVNPERSWNDQVSEELIWIRHDFISKPHALPRTVPFGHTSMKDVIFNLPNKIGLDTGLVYGNTLSCLETTGRMHYQISHGRRKVSVTDVSAHWENYRKQGH
jgi:serine/threonine protein phosphatase 1